MPQPVAPALSSARAPDLLLPVSALSFSRSDSVADLGSLSWLNVLLGWLWPKANTALSQYVHDDLTHMLREALPSPFKNVRFSRFTLGQNAPEFGPIEVVHHSETHVEVDLDVRYFSDVDVLLDAGAGGITVGVRQLTVVGRLCLVLRPVMSRWPVIGAVKVFCPALPQISLQFTGLAAVAHHPGIQQQIQRTVDDWMRSRMVLPNKSIHVFVGADSEEDVDLFDTHTGTPVGVLRVRVLGARHLAGVNWRALEVDKFDSDPYCMLRLGSRTVRTSTVSGSTSPVWPPSEPGAYFVVHHRDQQLEIDVFGEDRGGLFAPRNFTGFLGSARVAVSKVMRQWPTQQAGPGRRRSGLVLDTSQVSRDMLHVNDPVNRGVASEIDVEVEWFDLLECVPSVAEQHALLAGGDAPVAVLSVELRKGIGFPAEAVDEKAGLRWRCRVEAAEGFAVSGRGKLCDVEEPLFPEVGLHPRLFSVVDKLLERGYTEAAAARIVGADSPDVIPTYLHCKREYEAQCEALLETRRIEGHRVSLQWQEALLIFVRSPDSAALQVALLDGEDHEIGHLGHLPVRSMIEGCALPRALRPLELTPPSNDVGSFVSWLLPGRAAGPDAKRFASVEMDVSARIRFLRPGRGLPHRGRGGGRRG